MVIEKQKTIWLRNKHPMLRRHHSKDMKRKISENKERSKKISKSLKGRKINWIDKIIETRKKNNFKHSELTKLKMKKNHKGTLDKHWKLSNNTKRKMSESKKGIKKIPFSENHKNNMKIARRKFLQNYNFPTKVTNTSIEIKIQNFLKQLNIEYFTHQYMNINHSYLCDILVPSMNLVIECDGNYWHKFPIGNNIDNIRTSELLEQDFKVLRLWESEIKVMNVDEFNLKLKGGIEK